MARKKASGQKSASKTGTKSTNKTENKTSAAKKPKAAPVIDDAEIRAEIDQLATRTLALWREQMTALAQSPRAMQDMTKLMEPVFSLFTRGFDMWLMMLDQFAKTVPAGTWADFASPRTPAASAAAKPASKNSNAAARTTQKPEAEPAARPAAKSAGGKKKPASRAKTAAPASDTSGAAVAEMAKRLATLKQQNERTAAKPAAAAAAPAASSARVGRNQATVANLADARSRSRRKA